jgi:2-keto-3-deoxy-galactonokinase
MEPIYNNLTSVLNSSVSNTSLSGAIKGITEQTASVLAGQVTGIRISQAESTSLIRQQLLYMSEIAGNTRYNKHLESIDSKLDSLKSDPLRAQGIMV